MFGDAIVLTKNNIILVQKLVSELQLGDVIISEHGRSTITNIVKTTFINLPIVKIENHNIPNLSFMITATHKVFINDTWIYAKDYPNAIVIESPNIPDMYDISVSGEQYVSVGCISCLPCNN